MSGSGAMLMQDELKDCDKLPILKAFENHINALRESQEQISASQKRITESQEKMADAVIDIARHHERIVSLADKSSKNEEAIQKLFGYHRELEQRVTSHIESPGHTAAGNPESLPNEIKIKAEKWDKLNVAIITALVLGCGGAAVAFVKYVFITSSGGTP